MGETLQNFIKINNNLETASDGHKFCKIKRSCVYIYDYFIRAFGYDYFIKIFDYDYFIRAFSRDYLIRALARHYIVRAFYRIISSESLPNTAQKNEVFH